MFADTTPEAGGLRSVRKHFGIGGHVRTTLILLASLLVWVFEAFLLAVLWSAHASRRVPMSFYVLPVVHLLPWLAALQLLRKVSHAVRNGTLDAASAGMCYSVIIALLAASYASLSAFEIAFGLAWRFGTKVFSFG
jgi:hypothetical protein